MTSIRILANGNVTEVTLESVIAEIKKETVGFTRHPGIRNQPTKLLKAFKKLADTKKSSLLRGYSAWGEKFYVEQSSLPEGWSETIDLTIEKIKTLFMDHNKLTARASISNETFWINWISEWESVVVPKIESLQIELVGTETNIEE